jgi:aminopeptidase N
MFKFSLIFILVLTIRLFATESSIQHNLFVKVDPANHYLTATDTITIPANQVKPEMFFLLHGDLTVKSKSSNVIISLEESEITAKDFGMDQEDFEISSQIKQNKYKLRFENFKDSEMSFILGFEGKIHHPVQQLAEEYARGFSTSPGIISEEGVYLGGSTYWIPWFNDKLITFKMTVSVPDSWDIVSQGKRTLYKTDSNQRIVQWDSPEQMEEIFLIAAPFTVYTYSVGAVEAMAYLRTPDENLANKYLETTAQYLEMYRKLIGPYPFAKFALVENFWETGYGMPSFTLLGKQVIRFPFILHSSYPHELLHNWWGNSVYVDFDTGNWCEGLTAYMADHLIQEQRGQGDEYRRGTLQRYTDYVNVNNDFPLSKFLSRNNAATEAVGYGKSQMLWEMLREKVGDETFIKGFQTFNRENKFKRASFDDIRKSFESVSGLDLKPFFNQWVKRTGAPELKLSDITVNRHNQGYKLQFKLDQIQNGDAYDLDVPVAISFADNVVKQKFQMNQKSQTFEADFPERPLFISVDPQFNLFRRLHYNEIPPALSKVFGAEKVLIILPSQAAEPQLNIYKKMAETWSDGQSDKIEIITDSDIKEIPDDKAVWVLGWENAFRNIVDAGTKDYDMVVDDKNVTFGKSVLDKNANSFIITSRHPKNPNSVVVLLTIDREDAIAGLARKLPHYGKYSYLAFEGSEPTNVAKGQWPAVNSPLAAVIPGPDGLVATQYKTDLPRREALARLEPVFSADRMMEHVKYLASEELQGRGIGTEGLDKAADYIKSQFENAGLKPGGDANTYFQQFTVPGKDGKQVTVKNVIGILPGSKSEWNEESVIVSAHYDHLGLGWPDAYKDNEGKVHYGADDNASGVSVLLELAQTLGKTFKPDRTVIFIAFSAEESGLLGSQYYVKNAGKYVVSKIMGVLNLDTVGRLGNKKLLVLNSNTAREWRFIFMGASYVTGVESEMVAQDLDASDQVSFIKEGIPGVQFFSGAHRDYHRPTDTIDKIDAAGLVKVATFVREGVLYLAERDEPLTFTGTSNAEKPVSKSGPPPGIKPQSGRKVSTGTMPDFAYTGSGVRIASLAVNSPADKAGLKTGDVIIKFGEFKVTNLREYSDALKNYKPGDSVDLVYLRGDEENTTKITLEER